MQYNVFIGRVQPPHNAHIQIIKGALYAEYNKTKFTENPNRVIICIGSAFRPRTPKDPFIAKEREKMIRSCLTTEENDRVQFAYIADSMYDDTKWLCDIQDAVDNIVAVTSTDTENTIRLVGHKKDDSSFYLDMFPQWKFIGISNIDDMHSTTIRDYYFNENYGNGADVFTQMCKPYLPAPVFEFLLEFRDTDEFKTLQEEFTFVENYKKAWENAPYPPTFITCDAVVVQSGHLLMVRRKEAPGKGLWALPGGFVNPNETIQNAAIRELEEETQLKVPAAVLHGSIKDSAVFDHPGRSQRGRTVTHAYYIKLNPGPLPRVKGADDAEKAQWVPINEVLASEQDLFEDHASIIKYFI